MRRFFLTAFVALLSVCASWAQIDDYSMDGFTVTDNTFNPNRALDSLKASHKKVPKGMRVWTIDDMFGDMTQQVPDTAQHLVMNSVFTEGPYGEYNTTGNLGSPRISRIATDRDFTPRMPFLEPYGYFITKPSELRFTNTLSPITNLYYNSCGDKTDGEDQKPKPRKFRGFSYVISCSDRRIFSWHRIKKSVISGTIGEALYI